MLAMIPKILDALISIPKIAGYVELAVSAIVSWYVTKQTTETLSAIADAAAFAARANSDEDRYKAAEMWRAALSRDRYIN